MAAAGRIDIDLHGAPPAHVPNLARPWSVDKVGAARGTIFSLRNGRACQQRYGADGNRQYGLVLHGLALRERVCFRFVGGS